MLTTIKDLEEFMRDIKWAQAEIVNKRTQIARAQSAMNDAVRMQYRLLRDTTLDATAFPLLSQRIDALELTARTMCALKNYHISHIGDLVRYSEAELWKAKSFGKRGLSEVKKALIAHNLVLGMRLENWPTSEVLNEQ